jgi:nanoRNase/pAp phosphatase (c-di-AMP/oligoRNAs hydrolase)
VASATNETAAKPLLVIVSDSPRVDAEVRSRDREVRRWYDGEGVEAHPSFEGDPTDPATYEWTRTAPAVSAVIDLQPAERARAVLKAMRTVRPDTAALILSSALSDVDKPYDGTYARAGHLRDVLRVDLDEELERLEAERRAYCLRQFASGADVIPILMHPDPDPDAVSSAYAIVTLLHGDPQRTPIVTLSQMTRPENRRMAELLHIQVTEVTEDELRHFERVITVDTQPRGLQQDGHPRVAVIDHHPHEDCYTAEFFDVRPQYGATATMMTEYLRAMDPKLVHEGLATALLFGIKTDTDSLARGVSPADVSAYAWLQAIADPNLIRRFERPSYALGTARAYGEALARAESEDGLCITWLGELAEDETHVLADIADFALAIENVTWAVVGALLEESVVLSIRHTGTGIGAGEVARTLAQDGGKGGGHATMARVTLSRERAQRVRGAKEKAPEIRRLVNEAMASVSSSASRPDSHPIRPASARAGSGR